MAIHDDIFKILEDAEELEDKGGRKVEAATKYYEAVYLMKRHVSHLQRLPQTEVDEKMMALWKEKIGKYGRTAARLMADPTSIRDLNPRSPVGGDNEAVFFDEIPIVPAVAVSPSVVSETVAVDTLAARANRKLSTALDIDESKDRPQAINAYMEAAELYLQALRQAEESSRSTRTLNLGESLKKRLQQTLDRVEQLKRPPEVLSRVIPPKKTKPKPILTKRGGSLTVEEIKILKNSSLISSGLFLPWSDEDADRLSFEQSTRPFQDPDGIMKLSMQQKPRFHKWARPQEICRIRQANGLTRKQQEPVLVHSLSPFNIRQQYVTDCSFIASLCICAAFERRFNKQLITSILYPQNKQGMPVISQSGKYMVKLWLNGVARCVTIDDKLPIDKQGNLLCSISSMSTDEKHLELWVCLIEKAFMKLCGGYNFPGSNSGYDLFSLTGWIPERILFAKDPNNVKDFETHPNRAWQRIIGASSYGDCLITVSTQSDLSVQEAERIGLVTGHAYAVLSVIQTNDGTRLLQLKNPWARKGWVGKYSSGDTTSWTPALRSELGYNPTQRDDGVFWISWDDILKYFQNFHLSWTPNLFSLRTTLHGFWPRNQGPNDDTFNVSENPQYILTLSDAAIKKKATIWMLISRHVAKQEQEGQEASDFLTLHLHRNNSSKSQIAYPGRSGNCVLTGAYTNDPHVLIRYDVTGNEDRYLSLVLSQYKKSNDLPYTLSCYSSEEFTLGKPRPGLPATTALTARLTPKGGPMGSNHYEHNPMFAISVPKNGTAFELRLNSSKSEALHALLIPVRSFGDTYKNATGEPLVDSGKYRHGFVATPRQVLPAGSYVLVVSRFCRSQASCEFEATLLSSNPLKTKMVQQ